MLSVSTQIGNNRLYHMAFGGINHLYIALMSFKYIVSISTFMLPWQHHIKVGHLILIVLIFDFNLSIYNSLGSHVICKLVDLTLHSCGSEWVENWGDLGSASGHTVQDTVVALNCVTLQIIWDRSETYWNKTSFGRTLLSDVVVQSAISHLRPSHTEWSTGGRPPTTKIITDHLRPSATMVTKKMMQSHWFWSATGRTTGCRPKSVVGQHLS